MKLRKEHFFELARFGVVGLLAAGLQYLLYWIFLFWMGHNLALLISYLISFIFNFFSSARFTFRSGITLKRAIGFAISHLINLFLQMVFLNLFINFHIPKRWAFIPMLAVTAPINFILVRTSFKKI